MKKFLLISIAMVVGLWLLAGCAGGSSIADPEAGALVAKPEGSDKGAASLFDDPTPADPVWRWCMMYGQHYKYGGAKLVMETDADGNEWWYMKYWLTPEALAAGWMFCDAHVYAGDDPPTKGSPGKFPYKWDWEGDPDELTTTVMLPLGDWSPSDGGDYLAIHATICRGHWEVDPKTGAEYWVEDANETGWGGYCSKYDDAADWDGYWKKWGGWVYTASGKGLPVFDPVMEKCYTATHYGPFSYWRVRFATEDWYPFPGGNDWVGWCTDPRTMYSGRQYCVDVYSSYDPTLPAYAQSDNWEFISYMIDMRNKGAAPFDKTWSNNYWKDRFQEAVWYFKYGTSNYSPAAGSYAWTFINDAIANGDNYVPGPGDWYAVILWPRGSFQMNIIEVDP